MDYVSAKKSRFAFRYSDNHWVKHIQNKPSSFAARVEHLEGRQYWTATVKLDSHFGTNGIVKTGFGDTMATPYAATQLKDGRLLVFANDRGILGPAVTEQNVFVLYYTDGTLAKGFNKTGIIRQSSKTTLKFGFVNKLIPLADDSVIVEADDGLHRLRADGTWDTAFGTNGTTGDIPNGVNLRSDGSFQVLEYVSGNYRTRVFNSHGRPIGAPSPTISGNVTMLPDGRVVAINQFATAALYTSSIRKINTFGTGGDLNLQPTLDKYVSSHGPWYQLGAKIKPYSGISGLLPTASGGFNANAYVGGSKQSDPDAHNIIRLSLTLTATGKVTSIQYTNTVRTEVTSFSSSTQGFGGVFRFPQGDSADFLLNGVPGDTRLAVRAADGSFYVLGEIARGAGISDMAIVHTQPLVGHITGTVFGDANANGKRDPNEAVGIGKLVFLDSNNNGVLDAGEPTATSDKTGRYVFSNLGPGQYVVRRTLPRGYRFTTPVKKATLNLGQRVTVDIGSK